MPAHSYPRTLARSTTAFAAGTVFAFTFAAVREVLLARTLGVGAVADLVLLAMSLPHSLATSSTAHLDSVVLPTLARATAARAAIVLGRIERGLVTFLFWFSPVALLGLVHPALRASTSEGWTSVGTVLAISIGLFVALGLLSFRIRCRLGRAFRFVAAGAAPALPALGSIVGIGVMVALGGAWWPPLGFLAGGVVAMSLAGPTRSLFADAHESGRSHRAQARRYAWLIIRRSLPVTVGAVLFSIAGFTTRVAATIGPAGSAAALEYATRVFNVPNTLVTMSAAAVLLPLRTGRTTLGTSQDFQSHAWWSVAVMAPMACALTALAPAIARLLLGTMGDAAGLTAITYNITGLVAGLPAILLGNMRVRADQALRNYHSTLAGGVAFASAATLTAFVLVVTRSWHLFGFAQTAGLAGFLSVIAVTGSQNMPPLRAHTSLALALASGLVGSLAGAAVAGFVSSWLAFVALATALGGWAIGLGTVTLINRPSHRARPSRPQE